MIYVWTACFITARCYAKLGVCRRRVSVCLSVTLRYCIKTAKHRITQIMPHDSSGTRFVTVFVAELAV